MYAILESAFKFENLMVKYVLFTFLTIKRTVVQVV